MKTIRISTRTGLTLIELSIVILVMGIIMAVLGNMLSNIAFLKTSDDEAVILKDSLIFCRRSAIKSNQIVYFELNISESWYRAYRFNRQEEELKEEEVLKKHELSGFNSLVGVNPGMGSRITSGKVTIHFTPDGMAEEMAIYIGNPPEIKRTVFFSRYAGIAEIKENEAENKLINDQWKENLESW